MTCVCAPADMLSCKATGGDVLWPISSSPQRQYQKKGSLSISYVMRWHNWYQLQWNRRRSALPGISRWHWFEEVIEIHNDFIQREDIFHHDTLVIYVHHIPLDRPAILEDKKKINPVRTLLITCQGRAVLVINFMSLNYNWGRRMWRMAKAWTCQVSCALFLANLHLHLILSNSIFCLHSTQDVCKADTYSIHV